MLYFVICRAFSFKVEDLFGVGSITGQAKIKRMNPMTTIPMKLPMLSMREVFSFIVLSLSMNRGIIKLIEYGFISQIRYISSM